MTKAKYYPQTKLLIVKGSIWTLTANTDRESISSVLFDRGLKLRNGTSWVNCELYLSANLVRTYEQQI